MSKKSGKKSLRNGWPLLEAIAFEQIPLREVSGLAIAPLPRGLCLVAVGDHGPGVALAPLDSGRMSGWDVLDLAKLAKPAGAPEFDQAEAIAADGHQQALVLIEDPPLLLVLDTLNRRLTHAYVLVSGEHPGLDASWRDDSSSRGEGLVLLRRGHVLVLKEKRPAGLLEFGPPGDEPLGISADTLHHSGEPWQAPDLAQLVGLAWWPVDDTSRTSRTPLSARTAACTCSPTSRTRSGSWRCPSPSTGPPNTCRCGSSTTRSRRPRG